jgi:glycosyltransferase involved in cell wall biosynthesis
VPEMTRSSPEKIKQALGCEERTILCSLGLLSRASGIDYVIHALPEVIERRPDVLYFVIGQTYPEGEQYRASLIALAKRLRLEKHVRFVNQYLATPQLISYLQATDIYISPSLNRYQITGGTLAYALGCGRAIISTPIFMPRRRWPKGVACWLSLRTPGLLRAASTCCWRIRRCARSVSAAPCFMAGR